MVQDESKEEAKKHAEAAHSILACKRDDVASMLEEVERVLRAQEAMRVFFNAPAGHLAIFPGDVDLVFDSCFWISALRIFSMIS
jgi:hypothetical protein